MGDTEQPEVVVVVTRLPGGAGPRKSSTPPEATTYRMYKQRWWVLLTVVLLNISNAGVVAAVAENFIFYIPTKVSQVWFPESSRALATTILSMSYPFGLLVTQVTSPLLVTKPDQLPTLNYVFCGPALLAQLMTLVCVTRSMPPTPPSHSAALGERERAPYLQQLKDILTCLPFLLLLLTLGCLTAVFSCLATVMQQILCPLGYDDVFSGVAMAVMILCGIVGSVVSGVTAGRTKAFTPITKLCYGCVGISCIIMMEMFLMPDQHAILAVTCGLTGFFGVGAFPTSLELAVEATYPAEESISNALLSMSGRVQGVVIIAMVTLLSREMQAKYEYLEVCTGGQNPNLHPRDYSISVTAMMALVIFLILLFIIFFNTPYKRLEAESASNPVIPSTSSSHSLTATSLYPSEASSRNTTSMGSSRTGAKDGKKPGEADSEVDQCHL